MLHSAPTNDADADPGTTAPLSFVPCVEDAPYTRQLGRHPVAFQRVLDEVSHNYLCATARRSSSSCPPAAAAASLARNYAALWQHRVLVPRPARREWFETVMVHLHTLDRLEVGVAWLVDQLGEDTDITGADSLVATKSDTSAAVTGTAALLSSSSQSETEPLRKQPKGKKAAQDTPPLWYLWQDTQRHLHHLTLRLHTWTPAGGGAYAAREALRPSDLVRMDSAAFAWRVRLWTRVSGAVLTDLAATLRVAHPCDAAAGARTDEASGDTRETTLLLPSSTSAFSREEPELFRLLGTLMSTTAALDEVRGRRQLAGALLYRMLIEVTLIRLRALPRCLFTWRLLRDVLHRCVEYRTSRNTPEETPSTSEGREERKAVLLAASQYIEDVVIPYLEQRDCHLGNLNHTATEIHAHFARLARERLQNFSTATQNVAPVPLAFDDEGRLPEEQRLSITCALRNHIQAVCECKDDAAPASASAMCDVLANSDNNADASAETHDDASMTFDAATFALRREMSRKQVDERLFHSASRRTRQLEVFLHHYFTQNPTLAFDRPFRGIATNTETSSVVGEE